jgi:hypothetical protein
VSATFDFDPDAPEPPGPVWFPTVLDAAACPDEVAEWAAAEPGSAAAVPLAVLDPRRLSRFGQIDLLVAIEKQLGYWQALQYRALAAVAANPPVEGERKRDEYVAKRCVREQVSCALGVSAVTAEDRLARGEELVHRLPRTLDALQAGVISDRHARALTEAVAPLDDLATRKVEKTVLPDAGERSVATFRRKLAKAVLEVDPTATAKKHENALADRNVRAHPGRYGMSTVVSVLPADGSAALMLALDVAAQSCGPDDPRSMDQRRADALVQLAIDSLNAVCPHCRTGDAATSAPVIGDGPRWQGMRPTVNVTVARSTLLGYDEQAGEIDGGPVPNDLLLRITPWGSSSITAAPGRTAGTPTPTTSTR